MKYLKLFEKLYHLVTTPFDNIDDESFFHKQEIITKSEFDKIKKYAEDYSMSNINLTESCPDNSEEDIVYNRITIDCESSFSRKAYIDISIYKHEDDWWIIYDNVDYYTYKCDTIDGVFEYLKDVGYPSRIKRFKDWMSKINESVDEKWREINEDQKKDFESNHKNENFSTNEYNTIKERFGVFGNWNNIKRKFWFNHTRVRKTWTSYYEVIVVNEGESSPCREFYITKWDDEWFKVEYHYQIGPISGFRSKIFICDQFDGLLSLIDHLKVLSSN